MKTIKIPLRAVGYQEGRWWIAHCLELDIVGQGSTPEAALREMAELVNVQVRAALADSDIRSIYFPAPAEYWDLFARARARRTRMPRMPKMFESLDYRTMAVA